jgi:hypothetical protein
MTGVGAPAGKVQPDAHRSPRGWFWGTATARQRLLHRLSALTVVAADHPQVTSKPRCK